VPPLFPTVVGSQLDRISRMTKRSVAVFDLGGVLIDWNPRYLYRKLFNGDDDAMEHFLATVCTSQWNLQQDAGRSLAEACASLRSGFPAHAKMIDAWLERYDEMLAGPIHGTVDLLAELRSRNVPLYALSNWSAETFPAAQKRFDFLRWFRGLLLSGNVRLIKPDPRIFRLFCETHNVDPTQAVYIDDLQANVDAAAALGMHGIRFTDPSALRGELANLGLIPEER
jgi:2-haloacid dehalogenase